MSALGLAVVVMLAAEADPLKTARVAFGEGDADGCLTVVTQVLATNPAPVLLARAQFLRAQCLNLKDGPSRATQALEAALDADPEMTVDASRVDPALVGLFEGLKQRLKAEVVISSDRPDTVVMLDGATVGDAPTTIKVVAGRHRLVARTRDGRFAKEKDLVAHPRRSYELSLELAPVGVAAAPDPSGAPASPQKSWVNGLFIDARALADPGRGVGFGASLGWSARHFAASLHLVLGGYLGGAVRLGARLPLLGDFLTLGAAVEVPMLAVPGPTGGLAVGVGGNLNAALRWGIFEPFVEGGIQAMLAVPAAAAAVPRFSPLVGGGVRLYFP